MWVTIENTSSEWYKSLRLNLEVVPREGEVIVMNTTELGPKGEYKVKKVKHITTIGAISIRVEV